MANKRKFASADLTAGQLDVLVKKIGGHESALKFLRGEIVISDPSHRWFKYQGIIYFFVTTDGTTGDEWIKRFQRKKYYIEDSVKEILGSDLFLPTKGNTIQVAIITREAMNIVEPGVQTYWKDIEKIVNEKEFVVSSLEVGCLMRDLLTPQDLFSMGVTWLDILHTSGNPEGKKVLCLGHNGDEEAGMLMHACHSHGFRNGHAFAYRVSKPSYKVK